MASYSTTAIAKNAVNQFADSLKYRDGTRMAANSLNEYAGDAQLRQDYSPFTNYDAILGNYNTASDAAYDLARAEQIQAMNAAEDQNYSNTKSAIQQMRQALAGSASSGANRGAANATTAGMQGYQNTAKEAAAARAQNAVTALEAAKSGVDSMYGQATSAYNSDHLYGNQGIAGAIGTIASAVDTNASSERMNDATNKTNLQVAKTHTKQTIYNKK